MHTCADDHCPLRVLSKKSAIYSNFYRSSTGKKARKVTFNHAILRVWNIRINRESIWSHKCQSYHPSQERQRHKRTRAFHAWTSWKHSGDTDSPLHLSLCGCKPSSAPHLYRFCTCAISRGSTVHLLWTDINAFPNTVKLPNADKWFSTWEWRNSYRQLMY